NITIHCKSKDDDLGIHVIPSGQSYEWGFRVNFFGTTLFFCGFTTKKGRGVYDIFDVDRDIRRCPGSTCIWGVRDDGPLGKARVLITNNMPSNVTIHCKSKDDDLGIHVIPTTQSYEWGFRVNFWETTLFFCGFTTKKGGGVYDIFNAMRDEHRCVDGTCIWHVRDDG
ncbi:Self-incomp_S1 domain-containing protein, partial [Cephalotus follicularis]